MNLGDIYTEVIAEHSASLHNRRHLPHPTVKREGKNPSCGDEIELELQIEGGRIADASFTGSGCAISQASASMLADLVRGKTVGEAKALASLFGDMIRGKTVGEHALDPLEEAAALQSIGKLPSRVKCATMPWHTLEDALGTGQE